VMVVITGPTRAPRFPSCRLTATHIGLIWYLIAVVRNISMHSARAVCHRVSRNQGLIAAARRSRHALPGPRVGSLPIAAGRANVRPRGFGKCCERLAVPLMWPFPTSARAGSGDGASGGGDGAVDGAAEAGVGLSDADVDTAPSSWMPSSQSTLA
jgi:hypothetical protein